MEMRAVKHLDPVVGVDLHAVIVAPSPTPVFVPHPHIGFILDLREYITAAMAVIGSIAMTIVEEKVVDYLQDHPDVVKDLGDAAQWAGNKLDDAESNALVAKAMTLGSDAANMGADLARIAGDMANATGAGVGMGGGGRPIFVNGFMRTTAGTHTYHVPGLHFPLGESFAPVPSEEPVPPEPSNDAESYMGSKTVLANNDPMSFMALPAMSCWSIGLEPPQHNGVHTHRTYPSMPSSFMLPIPVGRPVLVGGPPTMNMAALAVGLFKAFRGSEWAKKLADKLHLKPGFLRCNVLHAEPVDATTGEVIMAHRDFIVAGRLPLVWDRCYAGHDKKCGTLGVGWRSPADIRLELMVHEGKAAAAAYFPDHATAFDTMPDANGWSARVYDWQYGYALYQHDDALILRMRTGHEYAFILPVQWRQTVERLPEDAVLTLPIGRVADLNGNAWVYERGRAGNLERLVEWQGVSPTGRVIGCESAVPHNAERDAVLLTALTLVDADSNAHPLVGYEHDAQMHLLAAVDAMGKPYRFVYDAGHRMIRHTSARGVSFFYSHLPHEDGLWRVDHTWGDDGLADYRFSYDLERRETRIVDSLGHTTVLQCNASGMPVAKIDAKGGISSYRYDDQGRTSLETDAAGRATKWEYDRYGNLTTLTLPDGRASRGEYDADHRPIRTTDPAGREWRYEWDTCGRVTAEIGPAGEAGHWEYDLNGQVVKYAPPHGSAMYFEYDRDGNLAQVTDALGRRTRYGYDARANLVQAVDTQGQVSRYEYDRNGNLTRAIEPGGREVFCSYDADGNLSRFRDPHGRVASLEYSALGNVTKLHTPDGSALEYRHDTEERLIGVLNGRGELYQLKRDALGRIIEEIDYRGQRRRYEFGAKGELLRCVDPLNRVIDYESDSFGRIIRRYVPDPRRPGGIRVESFEFDANGNLIIAENPDCRIERTYDAAGRLIQEKQGEDFTIVYGYDAANNPIEARSELKDGDEIVTNTTRYGYDELGAVSKISIDDAPPIAFERDAFGRVAVEHFGADLRCELSFTSDGRVAKKALYSGVNRLFAREYAYSGNGEMYERRDTRGGTDCYRYDAVSRVIEHLDSSGKRHRFSYDAAGDLLKHPIAEGNARDAADVGMRAGEHEGCYYEFDRAGNMVRKIDSTQDVRLQWDGDGLLIETIATQLAAGQPSSERTRVQTRYTYDVFRRRIGKVTQEWCESGSGNESMRPQDGLRPAKSYRFFWDGNRLIAESSAQRRGRQGGASGPEDKDAEMIRHYIYRANTFEPLAMVCRALQRPACPESAAQAMGGIRTAVLRFFHNDINGAPCDVTDGKGVSVWRATYSVCGKAQRDYGTGEFAQSIRLQGQYEDEETGLHYARHRYYDPSIGQFISEDPIRLLGGANLYAYANNIFEWSDPLGLSKKKQFDYYTRLPAPMGPQITDWMRNELYSGDLTRHKAILDAGRNVGAYMPDNGDITVGVNWQKVLHTEEIVTGGVGLINVTDRGALFTERSPCLEKCDSPIRANDAIHDVFFLYVHKYGTNHGAAYREAAEQERLMIVANRLMAIHNMDLRTVLKEFRKNGEWKCE